MTTRYILSDYLAEALRHATFKKLDDGAHCARIPGCEGLVVFGDTLEQSREELRSALEEWVLLGLKLGHALPVIAGIDLNEEPSLEPGDSV